jgi:hypothetical protein
MPGRPWMVIVLVFLVVWPLLGLLRDLRYRVLWVREAQGGKEKLRRFLRSTVAILLHLVRRPFSWSGGSSRIPSRR